MDVSDQESVESSSSDEGSEGEEEGVPNSRAGEGLSSLSAPRVGVWETEDLSDDGGMASAVASANQRANKFLEDSDSEEEMNEGPRYLYRPIAATHACT